jgi:tetratricopeptide (TPR) repeat protein
VHILLLLFVLALFSTGCQDSKAVANLHAQASEYEERGEYEQAIQALERILELDPRDFRAANSIAGIYGLMEEYERELEWAQKAIAMNPEFSLAYINLGNAYMALGMKEEGIEQFELALNMEPRAPDAPYSLGVYEAMQMNWEEAKTYYLQALAIDEDFASAHFNLAFCYANQDDLATAIRHLERAQELEPGAEDIAYWLELMKNDYAGQN